MASARRAEPAAATLPLPLPSHPRAVREPCSRGTRDAPEAWTEGPPAPRCSALPLSARGPARCVRPHLARDAPHPPGSLCWTRLVGLSTPLPGGDTKASARSLGTGAASERRWRWTWE